MKFFELSCSHGASLTCYILDERPIRNQNRTPRPGIIIVPGGGYHRLVDHEQECVAVQFVSKGYHTFILNYSVNEDGKKPLSSIPLEQLASAVALLRKSSKEWDLDPECIAVVGFSAGGHLAGSLAVHWDKEWLFRRTGLSSELIKPNALILAYPVIVGSGSSLPHRKNSIDYLLGDDASEEERYTYSLEEHVGRHVAPVFLWHTIEDECAPVEASMLFANACICAKVPLELHIFPKNQHGLSLASKETAWNDNSEDAHIAHWLMLCDEWLNIIWKEKILMEKLLIVDDEEWIVEGLKLQLPWEKYGIVLTEPARNGKEALKIIERERPSIVMSDIRMPQMDGLELAEYVCRNHKECEFIIISGYTDFEYAKKAMSYGVIGYVTKPVECGEKDDETVCLF